MCSLCFKLLNFQIRAVRCELKYVQVHPGQIEFLTFFMFYFHFSVLNEVQLNIFKILKALCRTTLTVTFWVSYFQMTLNIFR